MRVLIADDNPRFLQQVAQLLAERGDSCLPCEGGQDLFALAEAEAPDCALVHAELAAGSGLQLAAQLNARWPRLPLMLMLDGEPESAAALCAATGAANILVRPLRSKELLFALRVLDRLVADSQSSPQAAGEPPANAETPPSGLVSQELFRHFLRLELNRLVRYGTPLALLALKADALPHAPQAALPPGNPAGEAAVHRLIVQILSQTLRAVDLISELGDQELLVALPHTDSEGAWAAAERIRAAVARQPLGTSGLATAAMPSLSVGIAFSVDAEGQIDTLIDSARHHLSLALQDGGNQCRG